MKNKVFKIMSIMLLFGVVFLLSCTKDDDQEAPTLSILSPTSDFSYLSENNTITISGVASDDTGIESVEWKDSHGNSGTAFGTENWEIRNASLQNGDNVFTITAYDKAENSTSAEIMITYNKYLTFIGMPFFTPNSVFVNTPTDVTFNVTILSNPNLDENSVSIVEVDQNGNEIEELCQLYDDGDLSNGDEIKGDGVFSCITSFNRTMAGDIYLRAKANTTESEGTVTAYSAIRRFYVVEEMDEGIVQETCNTQIAGYNKYKELAATLSKDEAISQTIEFLKSYSNVSSVDISESNDICINYTSGLEGMILTGDDDQKGGGMASVGDRNNTPSIPLAQQTRGTYDETRGVVSNPDILLDRNVLLFSPYYDEFADKGWLSEEELHDALIDADCSQFNITYLKNSEANLAALKSLNDYGLIFINSHGSVDKKGNVIISTGEEINISDQQSLNDWSDNRLTMMNDLKWGVKPSFISDYNYNLPNSIVYVGSCSSAYNSTMAYAFLGIGAQTYYGYSNSVKGSFEYNMASELFPKIITENKTTGNAFTANQHDNSNPAAYFVMIGNSDLKYLFGFVNGNFEEGTLDGYIPGGDGRVITQLGYIAPKEGNFMGIISTGLGFTTQVGVLQQSFCIPEDSNMTLSFNWNFLSEEFMEYVGSQYQDYFKVSVIDQVGVEHTLFSKSIDDIAADYELTHVSPEIVFDRGDVYGTGWRTTHLDLSAYAGQRVTLVFASSDIGDSIFDTAILLDNITVEE